MVINLLMESKFKNPKKLQIIYSFDQTDLNVGELPWNNRGASQGRTQGAQYYLHPR